MGLGPYPAMSLAKARGRATDLRAAIQDGRDPLAEKAREAEPTFAECADKFLASMESLMAQREASRTMAHDAYDLLSVVCDQKSVEGRDRRCVESHESHLAGQARNGLPDARAN